MTRRGALTPGELAACVDGTWDAARLGIAAGYSNGHTHTDGKSSEIDADTFRLAAYRSAPLGGFNLKSGASFSWSSYDSKRHVKPNCCDTDQRLCREQKSDRLWRQRKNAIAPAAEFDQRSNWLTH
ncbi:MAG: autotransporter outer membrane beta-barrel domain-containing protein [Proteobacteria bacterium]|nr:autotransporter outer membrane beta-barrel domain-containing protein [Pseudomonadota bacterium]